MEQKDKQKLYEDWNNLKVEKQYLLSIIDTKNKEMDVFSKDYKKYETRYNSLKVCALCIPYIYKGTKKEAKTEMPTFNLPSKILASFMSIVFAPITIPLTFFTFIPFMITKSNYNNLKCKYDEINKIIGNAKNEISIIDSNINEIEQKLEDFKKSEKTLTNTEKIKKKSKISAVVKKPKNNATKKSENSNQEKTVDILDNNIAVK